MHDCVISFNVRGLNACFTDPITKAGGEQYSYPVPTYAALRGIVDNIYYKPTFKWHIRRVRVLNKIQYEVKALKYMRITDNIELSRPAKPPKNVKEAELGFATVLQDVSYNIEAEMYWDESHPELRADRNPVKHMAIAERSLKAGGRRVVYLGKREGNCYGEVTQCTFEDGKGFYDNVDEISFGVMVHGITYENESRSNRKEARLWLPVMRNGVIEFPWPSKCAMTVPLAAAKEKTEDIKPDSNQQKYELGRNIKFCGEEAAELWNSID